MSSEIVNVDSGAALYRQSTDAASLCREIVKKKAITLQGRQYVPVEGWQAIATAHGCVAGVQSVTVGEDGVASVAEIRRIINGQVIATAEGYVGTDEPVWYGGGKDKHGNPYKKRPMYAIRAMAQTRAISRVCRSAFAHVVVLIDSNLQTTPAEEVVGVDIEDIPEQPPAKKPLPRPPQQPAKKEHREVVDQQAEVVDEPAPERPPQEELDAATLAVGMLKFVKISQTKTGGASFGLLLDDKWYNTFSTTVGSVAKQLKDQPVHLYYITEGKYTRTIWVEAAQAEDDGNGS